MFSFLSFARRLRPFSSMISLTILSLDIDETVGNLSIEFSEALLRLVARLFMFLLIFNEQRVLKFTFVLVLTYYVNHSLEGAPHLLTAIGWSIVNIQSDLFWHRCLERQTFSTPRMYTLSPSKSIKRSNYGEFLSDKNVLLMHDCIISVQVRSEFGKFAYTAICMRNVYTLIW
jgi:hypothetical protein